MKSVLRLKITSSCIGIRRCSVAYIPYEMGVYSFKEHEHPLNKVNILIDNDDYITYKNEKFKLSFGDIKSFSFKDHVKLLTGQSEDELVFLELMSMPLDKEAIAYYEKSIKDGYLFDEFAGEFEYILYLLYKNEGRMNDASLYFNSSCDKGFKLAVNEKEKGVN